MRNLPPALASHLASGTTTLCRCWRLKRADGSVAGFTDHDRDLGFDGVTFAAASGLAASEAETQLGLAVSDGEVSGALTGVGITEQDIVAGRYDDAEIATFLVNWAEPGQRLLLDVAHVGEIRRAGSHFVAEVRGLAQRYDENQGRRYQGACSADLGDGRCKVALAGLDVAGAVTGVGNALVVTVAALAGKAEGWAGSGRIAFLGGVNAGQNRMVKSHHPGGVIELWEALPALPGVGDSCVVSPGCDKSMATCAAKFGNSLNFRGFPHIPTPDFVFTYALAGEGGHDGGALDP